VKLELTPAETLLKRTTSRCPVCQSACPAEVWKRRGAGGQETVWLERRCADHGPAEACVASDARFYWVAQGDPANQCCGGGACSAGDGQVRGILGKNASGAPQGAGTNIEKGVEALSTCLALIEIVNSCNLACPTCYADSPQSRQIDAVPLEDLQWRIQGVIDRKRKIEILQLSGGEPTLHPRFFELLAWCHANPGIDYVLLNTNGVRIAQDDAFADELAKTFRYGRFQLYLQFDGIQEAAQHALRGADLRAFRERAIRRCAAMNLPVTLAMTVTADNLAHMWEAIEYGLKWPNIRGIAFQPMFESGRVSTAASEVTDKASVASVPRTRLNTADIILSAVGQSGGKLSFDDFTPLPCGDPNCATIGYLLKTPDGPRSISEFIDFTAVQAFLRDKMRYSLEDLAQCGCESEPLGRLLHELELDESHTFRLFIKPFMDAWTWDEDRIDRCCTHVIRPDGKLDSFCRYYATSR
jgi:uncharacterized radical SAM superfamily Fe-S cluster-containing enzyme